MVTQGFTAMLVAGDESMLGLNGPHQRVALLN